MSEYRLKKDTPDLKAGTTFKSAVDSDDCANLYDTEGRNIWVDKNAPYFDDWFEKVGGIKSKEDDNAMKLKYYEGEMEAIDVIRKVTDGIDGEQAFCLGNIIKYVLRAGKKPGALDDLDKANNYAHRLVTGKWKSLERRTND